MPRKPKPSSSRGEPKKRLVVLVDGVLEFGELPIVNPELEMENGNRGVSGDQLRPVVERLFV
jgi:hypothetical protein